MPPMGPQGPMMQPPGNGALHHMGPAGPQMMQMPQSGVPMHHCEPQPGMAMNPQACGYWGQPSGPVPDSSFLGCNSNAPVFEPRQHLMTIEELPRDYQAIQDAGKKPAAIVDSPSRLFQPVVDEEVVTPTC